MDMREIIKNLLTNIENNPECQNYSDYKKFSSFEKRCDHTINNLEVFPKNSDLYIKKSDTKDLTISVSYKSDEECTPINVTQNGETLEVRSLNIAKLVACKITINLPTNVRTVSIDSETGNLRLFHQTLQNLKVNNRTGNVEIQESSLVESRIRIITGCLSVKKSQCEKFSVLSDNGNVSMDECILFDTNIQNKNGNITVQRSQTEVDDQHIKTLSKNGRVSVMQRPPIETTGALETGNQINLCTDNGNIALDLNGGEE